MRARSSGSRVGTFPLVLIKQCGTHCILWAAVTTALQHQAWKVSFYLDIPVLLNKTILITVETGMAEKMFEVRESSGVLGKIYLRES